MRSLQEIMVANMSPELQGNIEEKHVSATSTLPPTSGSFTLSPPMNISATTGLPPSHTVLTPNPSIHQLTSINTSLHTPPSNTTPDTFSPPDMSLEMNYSNYYFHRLDETNKKAVSLSNLTDPLPKFFPGSAPEPDPQNVKIDWKRFFDEAREGNQSNFVQFVKVDDQPDNTVFRFTMAGATALKKGLQRLCRENYKKLREYGVFPYGKDSQQQKVNYQRRLFQFSTSKKRQKIVHEAMVSSAPSNEGQFSQKSILDALSQAKKINLISYGLFANVSENFWTILKKKIEGKAKVKLLIADPRSFVTHQVFSDVDKEACKKSLTELITKLYHHISNYENFSIRFFHVNMDTCGRYNILFIDNQIRELVMYVSNEGAPSITFTNPSEDISQKYYSHWKEIWTRANPINPPKKMLVTENDKIFTSEAEFLKQVIQLYTCSSWRETVTYTLEITKKKVDLYGMTLQNLIADNESFLTVLQEHIQSTSCKFRILLKNPTIGCEGLENVKWIGIQGLASSILELHKLRQKFSEGDVFDKKVEVRLHNQLNYFTYFRFDKVVWLLHHSGPDYPAESSFLYQHSNKKSKEFKSIFKSEWEEAVLLENDFQKSGTKQYISWEDAILAAQNIRTEQPEITLLKNENQILKEKLMKYEQKSQ